MPDPDVEKDIRNFIAFKNRSDIYNPGTFPKELNPLKRIFCFSIKLLFKILIFILKIVVLTLISGDEKHKKPKYTVYAFGIEQARFNSYWEAQHYICGRKVGRGIPEYKDFWDYNIFSS